MLSGLRASGCQALVRVPLAHSLSPPSQGCQREDNWGTGARKE